MANSFGAFATLSGDWGTVGYYRLATLATRGASDLDRLPFTVKVLLENVLRRCELGEAGEQEVTALAAWESAKPDEEFTFLPSRVLLHDFTGIPAIVDLAAMRGAMAALGGDPQRINPLVPADLVIDHSVQIEYAGTPEAYDANVDLEYERNTERYLLLRWAQQAFKNLRIVPPGMGICHQVNIEYLSSVVAVRDVGGRKVAMPDTLVGADSHTPMVNGLGVLGWGVGGIEAEAVLLGQPFSLLMPAVVGMRLVGQLPPGTTATDLVLTATQLLRRYGVVGKFVEFTGPGLNSLSLPDRATLANMAPEYGATAGLFPVDAETLRYLRGTGRTESHVRLVERYTKEQGLFRDDETPEPRFSETLELDLTTVESSMAGPRRPQDRVGIGDLRQNFRSAYAEQLAVGAKPVELEIDGWRAALGHGSVVIAAITSCTNTSNPSVLIGAGLLAKKAVERGMKVSPTVKASLTPGSRAVTEYLRAAGLLAYLETLRFNVAGYGCATCVGNSGPLVEPVAAAVQENDLVVAAVLSGNRNFEGRIHPQVRAAYLASPPLVVAMALAGTVDLDLRHDPLGHDADGQPVYLSELWPSGEEIQATIAATVRPEIFVENYARITEGDARWRALPVPTGDAYAWDAASTYIQEPPFFRGLTPEPPALSDILNARALAVVGDSVTTDHISPAGSIAKDSPAGRYLIEQGVAPRDFNAYGTRRGNHQVLMRGTFGNIRLRNALVPGREGNWTVHLPDGAVMQIFDAAMRYKEEGTPLVVLAGKEYGSGSSRDWAAKGPMLLGVRAVIAESFERIHRSNLVGMGVLPLEFRAGESPATLGLTGREEFTIEGIAAELKPGQKLTVSVRRDDGSETAFGVCARLDNDLDVAYYRNGGVLQTVLRNLLR